MDNKECVKLLFAGDFCARNPEGIEIAPELKSIFDDCDIKCLNFEGPLKVGEPQIIQGSALLPQSDLSPKWCEDNDFNVVSLANNHALDFGEKGLEKTIKSFEKSITVGAGKWEEAYQVKYLEVKEMKFGFFSASQADFAALKDKWTDLGITGCPWINHYEVNQRIAEAKNNCDFLFVLPHAGVEYMDVPLPEWRDRYRDLIQYGADAIIAAHPHVSQGWELFDGKPIFYSLGNFYFDFHRDEDKKPENWDSGLIAIIEINNGVLGFRTISTQKVNKNINIDSSNGTKERLKRINTYLNSELYLEKVNEKVLTLWNSHEAVLLRGLNAIKVTVNLRSIAKFIYVFFKMKPKLKLTLGYLRTESARLLMARALKLLTGSNL